MGSVERRERWVRRASTTSTRTVGEEAIVYNRRTDSAHVLSGATAAVWAQVDSTDDLAQLTALLGASGHRTSEQEVGEIVEGLVGNGLLVTGGGVDRRRALLGIGAAVVTGPGVLTIAIPPPAAASCHVLETVTEVESESEELLEDVEDLVDPDEVFVDALEEEFGVGTETETQTSTETAEPPAEVQPGTEEAQDLTGADQPVQGSADPTVSADTDVVAPEAQVVPAEPQPTPQPPPAPAPPDPPPAPAPPPPAPAPPAPTQSTEPAG